MNIREKEITKQTLMEREREREKNRECGYFGYWRIGLGRVYKEGLSGEGANIVLRSYAKF